MTSVTLVNWGFVVGELQKDELIRSLRRRKHNTLDAYTIERYAYRDLPDMKTGVQDILDSRPIYFFGQTDDSKMHVSKQRIVYIAEGLDYIITTNGILYHLQGDSFVNILRSIKGYNPEFES